MPRKKKEVKKVIVPEKVVKEEKINDCGTKDIYDENNPYGK